MADLVDRPMEQAAKDQEEVPAASSFEWDFGNFITNRIVAAHRGARRNPAWDRKYKQVFIRSKEIAERIKEKVGWELFFEYDSVEGKLAALDGEAAYLQGLRDGLELAQKLWGRNGGGEPDGAASE